jgi:hypothetical protein
VAFDSAAELTLDLTIAVVSLFCAHRACTTVLKKVISSPEPRRDREDDLESNRCRLFYPPMQMDTRVVIVDAGHVVR